MRKMMTLMAIGLLAACGGGGGVSGDIGQACMAAGREAATPALCSCIQRVADQTLSGSDQNRAAKFFDDPQLAQEARTSDRPRDDLFWDRYRAFADRAESTCG
jgi:hypothetical protein